MSFINSEKEACNVSKTFCLNNTHPSDMKKNLLLVYVITLSFLYYYCAPKS